MKKQLRTFNNNQDMVPVYPNTFELRETTMTQIETTKNDEEKELKTIPELELQEDEILEEEA